MAVHDRVGCIEWLDRKKMASSQVNRVKMECRWSNSRVHTHSHIHTQNEKLTCPEEIVILTKRLDSIIRVLLLLVFLIEMGTK